MDELPEKISAHVCIACAQLARMIAQGGLDEHRSIMVSQSSLAMCQLWRVVERLASTPSLGTLSMSLIAINVWTKRQSMSCAAMLSTLTVLSWCAASREK